MDSGLKQLGETIAAALPGAVSGISTAFGELTLTVEAARLIETVTYLRDDPSCLFVSFHRVLDFSDMPLACCDKQLLASYATSRIAQA